jgi:hypothetical protein
MIGKGVVEWTNGDKYTGKLRDGQPNGYGIKKWSNNNLYKKYEGNWVEGDISGRGTLKFVGKNISIKILLMYTHCT